MIETIKLTEEEQVLWNKISFESDLYQPSLDQIRDSIKPAYELSKSLLIRKAIPLVRKKYFTEPEYNIKGRGKSRKEVFELNGTKGEEILKHPHFHKYLQYFILGPALSSEVIQEFDSLVTKNKPITSSDQESLCILARNQVKKYYLNPKIVSEEYFKLCLELNLNLSMARVVRDTVHRMKK